MCPITLGVAAVGAGVSVYGALQGAAAQKQAAQAQQRMNDLRAARQRTQQVRDARTARAQIEQAGANQGVGKSSSVQTGAAGANQQAYSNIEYIGFEQQTGQALSKAHQQEADAGGIASIGQGVMGLAGAMSAHPKAMGDAEDAIGGAFKSVFG